MLHRIPSRQPRHMLLGVTCALLFLLSLGFCLFYIGYGTNAEVPLLCGGVAMVLLWPLLMMVRCIWGEQVIQVEHAGVVVAFYLWGIRLGQMVIPAARMLHFDWEQSSDGIYSLRLLLLRPDGRSAFSTVMHTDSSYALASVWRDLELHYPGSGLRIDRPSGADVAVNRYSRLLGAALLLLGAGLGLGLLPHAVRPLRTAALGQVSIAEVVAVEWGSTQTSGSPYHLRVLPDGAEKTVRTASSFYSHNGRVPLPGQKLPVLWVADAACYLPGEVLSFIAPLPILGCCLVLAWFGIWGLLHAAHRPR